MSSDLRDGWILQKKRFITRRLSLLSALDLLVSYIHTFEELLDPRERTLSLMILFDVGSVFSLKAVLGNS